MAEATPSIDRTTIANQGAMLLISQQPKRDFSAL